MLYSFLFLNLEKDLENLYQKASNRMKKELVSTRAILYKYE